MVTPDGKPIEEPLRAPGDGGSDAPPRPDAER
jgi:hypothetical protein